jgi:hypothetical protein
MAATGHEHRFVFDGRQLLPCACGAELPAIEAVLSSAADDARRAVGRAHFTGCRLRQESETVELWMFDAPSQVLERVAVMGDVPTAQARLDASFGADVARVEYGEPLRALALQGS